MPSVGSHKAQNVTRSFAVTQEAQGAYFYNATDIDAWYAANQENVEKLGSLYIIRGSSSGTTFTDVLLGDNGATELDHTNPNITARKAIKDMGKEVIFGNGVESRLLVLRLVQEYVLSSEGGTLDATSTGYVVTENNCSDLQGNTGRFTVRVARV
jgi:hypothetical protein